MVIWLTMLHTQIHVYVEKKRMHGCFATSCMYTRFIRYIIMQVSLFIASNHWHRSMILLFVLLHLTTQYKIAFGHFARLRLCFFISFSCPLRKWKRTRGTCRCVRTYVGMHVCAYINGMSACICLCMQTWTNILYVIAHSLFGNTKKESIHTHVRDRNIMLYVMSKVWRQLVMRTIVISSDSYKSKYACMYSYLRNWHLLIMQNAVIGPESYTHM